MMIFGFVTCVASALSFMTERKGIFGSSLFRISVKEILLDILSMLLATCVGWAWWFSDWSKFGFTVADPYPCKNSPISSSLRFSNLKKSGCKFRNALTMAALCGFYVWSSALSILSSVIHAFFGFFMTLLMLRMLFEYGNGLPSVTSRRHPRWRAKFRLVDTT